MQYQIRARNLVKRRFERLDKRRRKLLNEPDRIGDGYFPAFRKLELARRGVQRGEQLVFRQHLGAGQGVEERRFSGVGVAHQRGHRQTLPANATLNMPLS